MNATESIIITLREQSLTVFERIFNAPKSYLSNFESKRRLKELEYHISIINGALFLINMLAFMIFLQNDSASEVLLLLLIALVILFFLKADLKRRVVLIQNSKLIKKMLKKDQAVEEHIG